MSTWRYRTKHDINLCWACVFQVRKSSDEPLDHFESTGIPVKGMWIDSGSSWRESTWVTFTQWPTEEGVGCCELCLQRGDRFSGGHMWIATK